MTTSAELLVDAVLAMPGQLPNDISQNARLHLLDAIGVGLAAAAVGPVRSLPHATSFSAGPCTVIGSSLRRDAADAALLNGTLIHSIEFDDTHTGSVMHGSSTLAPAVLAAAEEAGAEGTTALRAFVVGWEVIIRLGLAAPSGFQRNGFQGTSIAGTIAGALAVGLIQGLDRVELVNAVGIAASYSAGNFSFLSEGASVKAAQPGIAAQGAISAVRLARGGVTGASGVLDGRNGLFSIYASDESASGRFRDSLASLGCEWLIADAAFKEFPCCHFIHPFIEAVGRSQLDFSSAAEIAGIRCRVPAGQEAIIATPWEQKQSPVTAAEGRWSLPYALAVRLVNGDVTVSDFDGPADPRVVEIAHRISWELWDDSPYPERFPAEVELTLNDSSSETVSVPDANGNRTRPWRRGEVLTKFFANAELAGLTEPERQRFVDAFLDGGTIDLDVFADLVAPTRHEQTVD